MLETTLTQLEQLITELLQQNSTQSENISRLEQELQRSKEENDNLQLAAMELEEQQTAMLTRLQALVHRGGTVQKSE
jgi:butyrate kinase